MSAEYSDIFGAAGPLAANISGYRERAEQRLMAEQVGATLERQSRLVVEAGTGTGKTFAYLVPALLSGHRVIVSTGTKNLQEQLFHKDLPVIRNALGVPVRLALLKGRSNYLCLHRLERTESAGNIRDPSLLGQLRVIREWSIRTRSGDISEADGVREDATLWPRVTSTAENCLGTECPQYSKCFVVKARRAAQEADVVVVNHYLLFADLSLREEGFGEVLPGADAVILDEAHQLPHIASQFFGQSLTSRQLLELTRDARAEYAEIAGDTPELEDALDMLERAASQLDVALARVAPRAAWQDACGGSETAAALNALDSTLDDAGTQLSALAERSRGLESCQRRAAAMLLRLRLLQREAESKIDGDAEDAVAERFVRWVEKLKRGFVLHATPLDIAPTFRRVLEAHPAAWVFTSATLSVDGGFDHFTAAIGIPEADTLALESPFDYARNALLYLPPHMPDPATQDYTQHVVDAALPVMRASGGGVFLLFTSHRALRDAADYLAPQVEFPLFVQGEQGRGELLARFREQGNGILLGTSSFWEGVDVRGAALKVVVIDRLPFSSPGDPVLKARLEAMRARGESPFTSYQLPQAVIALKQGVGRLIRDHRDHGVLVLCDPRLLSRGYGRVFLNSLPDMPRTRDEDTVRAFFAEREMQM